MAVYVKALKMSLKKMTGSATNKAVNGAQAMMVHAR
jgi:hypothetical protein